VRTIPKSSPGGDSQLLRIEGPRPEPTQHRGWPNVAWRAKTNPERQLFNAWEASHQIILLVARMARPKEGAP